MVKALALVWLYARSSPGRAFDFFGFLGSFGFKWPRRVGLRVGGWTGGFFEKGRKESGIE